MSDWIRTAKVGDKVQCIRRANGLAYAAVGDELPVKDEIYTIRALDEEDGDIYLLLAEIINDPGYYEDGYGEVSFHYEGFRPVHPRKTNIAWAYELLNNVPAKQPESEVA